MHQKTRLHFYSFTTFSALLLLTCTHSANPIQNADHPKPNTMTIKDSDSILHKLNTDHYGDFFNYYNREEIIENVWDEPDSEEQLQAIVANEKAPMKSRFLACEVLSEQELLFSKNSDNETIAQIYAAALVNDFTGMANSWGLLYEEQDEGPVGIHFLMLGKSAILTLAKLLDNDSQKLTYAGSEEATIGNAYQYRIKDFAAYYISRIQGNPLPFHQDHRLRDREIEQLKASLERK